MTLHLTYSITIDDEPAGYGDCTIENTDAVGPVEIDYETRAAIERDIAGRLNVRPEYEGRRLRVAITGVREIG